MRDFCPKCFMEDDIKVEIVKNDLLERCIRCGTDYKFDLRKEGRGKVTPPIKGLRNILGVSR
ncbi:hypothetical protein A3781_19245 [Bacillus badius]|nr:hypothetical protein A3781_19245 [Bacillus badius]